MIVIGFPVACCVCVHTVGILCEPVVVMQCVWLSAHMRRVNAASVAAAAVCVAAACVCHVRMSFRVHVAAVLCMLCPSPCIAVCVDCGRLWLRACMWRGVQCVGVAASVWALS